MTLSAVFLYSDEVTASAILIWKMVQKVFRVHIAVAPSFSLHFSKRKPCMSYGRRLIILPELSTGHCCLGLFLLFSSHLLGSRHSLSNVQPLVCKGLVHDSFRKLLERVFFLYQRIKCYLLTIWSFIFFFTHESPFLAQGVLKRHRWKKIVLQVVH